jgi:hypothetical protein
MKKLFLFLIVMFSTLLAGCDTPHPDADTVERKRQEAQLSEMVKQVGAPTITKFQEKRLLKQVYELRDRENLLTYTYTISEMDGKLRFLCRSMGYGIPAATQYNNPQQPGYASTYGGYSMPQAEPNGLFPPASADGTWIVAFDEKGEKHVIYVEPRVVVSPIKLTNE